MEIKAIYRLNIIYNIIWGLANNDICDNLQFK